MRTSCWYSSSRVGFWRPLSTCSTDWWEWRNDDLTISLSHWQPTKNNHRLCWSLRRQRCWRCLRTHSLFAFFGSMLDLAARPPCAGSQRWNWPGGPGGPKRLDSQWQALKYHQVNTRSNGPTDGFGVLERCCELEEQLISHEEACGTTKVGRWSDMS